MRGHKHEKANKEHESRDHYFSISPQHGARNGALLVECRHITPKNVRRAFGRDALLTSAEGGMGQF